MSSTNKTTNYELSQFLGSDKPAWLVDYNGDMQKIDTQMKANADAATAAQTKANTADGKADTNAGAIQTLDTEINGANGLASDLSALTGSVNTITSLIGNGEPTTTDKTLIGAINELNSDINGSGGIEEKIGNLTTLTTTEKSNLVGAINELKSNEMAVDNINVTVTADGVKTNAELLAELASNIDTYMSSSDTKYSYEVVSAAINSRYFLCYAPAIRRDFTHAPFYNMNIDSGNLEMNIIFMSKTQSNCYYGKIFGLATLAYTDRISETPSNGTIYTVTLRRYTNANNS